MDAIQVRHPDCNLIGLLPALGAEVGTAKLYLSDSTDSSNSVNLTFSPYAYVLEVPVELLDNHVDRTRARFAIIKLDTETTELIVLRGSRRMVDEYRQWIFCEVLHGRKEADLAEAMAGRGIPLTTSTVPVS